MLKKESSLIKNNKNLNIEGLRCVAMLCVLTYHLFFRFQELYCDYTTTNIFINNLGFLGVCVFLIISGQYEFKNKTGTVGNILISRIKKIWPMYFASVSIIYIVVSVWGPIDRKATILDYVLNIVFINGFVGTRYIDSAHWYISILVCMTLIGTVFRMLKLLDKWFAYVLWILINVVILKLKIPYLVLLSGGGYVGIICLGVFLSKCTQGKVKGKKDLGWVLLFILSFGYVILSKDLYESLAVFLAFALVFYCNYKTCSIFSNRLLVWLGSISYPVYLIHQNISYSLELYLTSIRGFSYMYPLICCLLSISLGSLLFFINRSLIFAIEKR